MKKFAVAVLVLTAFLVRDAAALTCDDLKEFDELMCFNRECNDEDRAAYELMKDCGIIKESYPALKEVEMRGTSCFCHVSYPKKKMDMEEVKATFFDNDELNYVCEKRLSHIFCKINDTEFEKGLTRVKPLPDVVACPLDCMKWKS